MADTTYDILIIGSGPGGYVGAIRAAQLGLKVAVVEKSYIGGICPNWGCIPTKALLRSAEIFHYMEHAKDFGLTAKDVGFDAAAIVKRSRGIANQMSNGVGFLLKKNKVDVIWGDGDDHRAAARSPVKAADNPPKGALGAGDYAAKNIIVATGARPRALPGIEPDGSSSGPISRRWCPKECRSRCSSSAPAPSASSSPRSTGRWAPR